MGGQSSDLVRFCVVELVDRVHLTDRRLHLDGDPSAGHGDYQIELTPTYTDVAAEDLGTTLGEETSCDTFAEHTQALTMPVGYMAEIGSSSSMLTSRNVMTFTLLTNRAGRNMSHTHASFNSNSK